MTPSEIDTDAHHARAGRVLTLVANECARYLNDAEELNARLFTCYWQKAEETDPDDRCAVLEIVGEILLNSDARECRWKGLLSPYLDPAGSVRQLLESAIRADRLDQVLAPYHDQLEEIYLQGPRDMIPVLALTAEILDGCPAEFLRTE